MKTHIFKVVLLCFVLGSVSFSGTENKRTALFFQLNLSGIDALKAGNYKVALKEALRDSSLPDTAFRYLKLGVICSNMNDESKALFYFRLAAQKSPILAPFAYEYIGDIETKMKQTQNALNAYRFAVTETIPLKYKTDIFEKIRVIYEKDSSNLSKGTWLDDYRQWLLPQIKTQPQIGKATILDTVLTQKNWIVLDSLVNVLLEKEKKSYIVDKLEKSTVPDSALKAKTLFTLAQESYSLKDYSAADYFFTKAKSKDDFATIPEATALYFEAKLDNSTNNLDKALSLYKRFEKKYGAEPDLVLTIARIYRKLDDDEEAWKWYNKFVKLYPNHQKTPEVIWAMAWRMELLGRYKDAATYYKKIYTTFKDASRVEEAYLRHAFCYFQQNSFDSTLAVLNNHLKKFPSSSQLPVINFWKAKTLLALDRIDSAKVKFKEVAQTDPYDYYAIRSRQLLQLLGDTTEYCIDTSSDTLATFKWLDSISPSNVKKDLSANDSLALYRGIVLLLIGRAKESDLFLDQIEQSFPGNLQLQFKLALEYQRANATMQAFRVARRLTWRIPQENRTNLPFLVYKLLFPTFYSDVINREAARRNVDPFLVSSVIRQESTFNPSIVSPAGAIGLMQIMPFTGKDVAKKIGESFTIDSLYVPYANIRYGTSYLRNLLDQFNDNLVLVLAGYNGGPENVTRWYKHNREDDFDLFIEDIEFTETRTYVKRVLANYWTYRLLSKVPHYAYGK